MFMCVRVYVCECVSVRHVHIPWTKIKNRHFIPLRAVLAYARVKFLMDQVACGKWVGGIEKNSAALYQKYVCAGKMNAIGVPVNVLAIAPAYVLQPAFCVSACTGLYWTCMQWFGKEGLENSLYSASWQKNSVHW